MAKPPAFQFYAKDWLADASVKLMTLAERGAYISLLAHNWAEGKLPAKLPALARLIDATAEEFAAIWPAVSPKFIPVDGAPGYISNPRMDADRVALEQRRVKQSEAGKATQALLHREGELTAKLGAKLQPAVAVASAVGTTLPDRRPTEPECVVRELLPAADYVQAFERLLRSAAKPDSLAASVRGFGPGGIHECASWDELGHALMDLAAAPGTATPAALKAFIRRIQAGDPPPRQRGPERLTQREKNLAVLSRIAAEEEVA